MLLGGDAVHRLGRLVDVLRPLLADHQGCIVVTRSDVHCLLVCKACMSTQVSMSSAAASPLNQDPMLPLSSGAKTTLLHAILPTLVFDQRLEKDGQEATRLWCVSMGGGGGSINAILPCSK